MMTRKLSIVFSLFLAIGIFAPVGVAQTTGFTYQGSLNSGGVIANGNHDFEFALFDAVSGGAQLGATITQSSVVVTNGIFAVSLDFGSQFPGAGRFLEIRVRPTGGGVFTSLAPRQQITSSPYAVKSLNSDTATTAINATQLGGVAANQYVLTGDTRLSDSRAPTAGSSNYIQNQNAALQNASNFNISGNGTATIFNAGTQYNLAGSRILSNGGSGNLFAGTGAGTANVSGNLNSFFGSNAGVNTTASANSFFGASAGQANSIGLYNSFFGASAGSANVGGGNTFFGHLSGGSNVVGSFNTAVGNLADVGVSNLTNATAIGANARVGASNSMVLGSIAGVGGATSDTSVAIGITIPSSAYRFHVKSSNGAIVGETTSTAQSAVYGFGHTGVWGSNTNGAGVGVLATSFVSGAVALKTTGTSWFQGDTTPLSLSATGIGTGIAIGSGGNLGYINSFDYGVFQGRNLALNSSGGNVSIGGTNALRTLHVNGRVRIDSAPVEASVASVCFTNQGDVVQCGASSLRWKSNVNSYTDGLNVLRQLRPISYNWKDGGAYDIGLGAEDVAKTAPFFAYRDKEGVVEGVRYDRLNMVLINSINEQQVQIEAQQKQIDLQDSVNRTLALEVAALKALICVSNQKAAMCKAKK